MTSTPSQPVESIASHPLGNGSSTPLPKMPFTMRQTADAVIAAFNNMDIDGILAHRAPDCMREFLPRSMKYPSQDNDTYGSSLRALKHVFHNFSLVVDNIVEDTEARRMCLCLQASADTMIGRYDNDYVWMWDFDDAGVKIKRSKEFSDSVMGKEFYPKLSAAMKARAKQAATVAAVGQVDEVSKKDSQETDNKEREVEVEDATATKAQEKS